MNHDFTFRRTLLVLLLCSLSASFADAEVIQYTLPRAGKVSLSVYDGQGRQVRTLLAGEAQSAGEHLLQWDGLDRLGGAMPVGSYEWRLLLNDGLEADYLAVVGQSPINAAEPWAWTVGSHQGPSTVVMGAGGTIYHGSRNSEGPPVLMKLGSENGPVLWTRDWQSKGPVDMVELGADLYVLGWNAELQRVDAATGLDDGKPLDLLWPGDNRPGCDDMVSSYGIKLGVDGENLVVAYREHGALRWIEPTRGAVLREVALASHKRWDAQIFNNAAINASMVHAGLTYDDMGCDVFTWSDANGNGALDAEEFRFHDSGPLMHGRYCAFDDQLNVYVGFSGPQNYCYTGKRWLLFDFNGSAYAKLPNLAAAGAATPVWDWSKLELSRAMLPDDLRGAEVAAVAARHDARGGVTLAVRGEIGANTDRHGLVWPEDTVGMACLLRALPDGTAWTVSKQKSPGMPAAAVMSHPGYFPGVAHGCIIASNRNHYGATAWTEDGLFAGFFLDRHKNDLPDWAYDPVGRDLSGLFAGDDWECAGSMAKLADGSVLWIPRAWGRAAVFRVRGWENWFRTSGKIELEPSTDYRGDGTAGAVTVGSVPAVTDGLAVAYLLDEVEGCIIHDSVRSAHAEFEVFMNPPFPRWQPTGGIRGGAIEFLEPSIRVNLPVAKISGNFTVAFWMRTQQPTQPVMVGSFDLILKDGHPHINLGGWPMAAPPDSPRLDDGHWHHVALVWDQSSGKRAMYLFVDAQPVSTGTGPDKGSTSALSLGVSNHLKGQSFIGLFDELRIYQRILTAEEILTLTKR